MGNIGDKILADTLQLANARDVVKNDHCSNDRAIPVIDGNSSAFVMEIILVVKDDVFFVGIIPGKGFSDKLMKLSVPDDFQDFST